MATSIEKNTKTLVQKKLDALFALQQKINNDATGSKAQQGTRVPLSSHVSYSAPDDYMDIEGMFGSLNTPQVNNMQFSNPLDNPESGRFNPDKSRENTLAGVDKGPNWGKAGTFAMQAAPAIYNMIRGLQKPEKTKPNYNPYEDEIRSTMRGRRFDIDPLLAANRTAQAVSNRNIRSAAGSRGALMGNLGAAQNYRMAGDAAAWSQKNNMDNQYLAEQAQMDYGLGMGRAQMDWHVQDANARNRAARNQFLGRGLSDLSMYSQNQQFMKNQRERDSQLVGLMPDMFNVFKYMPGLQDIYNTFNNGSK